MRGCLKGTRATRPLNFSGTRVLLHGPCEMSMEAMRIKHSSAQFVRSRQAEVQAASKDISQGPCRRPRVPLRFKGSRDSCSLYFSTSHPQASEHLGSPWAAPDEDQGCIDCILGGMEWWDSSQHFRANGGWLALLSLPGSTKPSPTWSPVEANRAQIMLSEVGKSGQSK